VGEGADPKCMLADELAAQLATKIDLNRAAPFKGATTETYSKHTISLATADEEGNTVCVLYSLAFPFGSGLATDKFGILLHVIS